MIGCVNIFIYSQFTVEPLVFESIELHFEIAGIFLNRSPLGDFLVFLGFLNIMLSNLTRNKNKIIITGDFNVKFGSLDTRTHPIINPFYSNGLLRL